MPMENKTVIILCPTYRRAVYEWKILAGLPLWTRVNKFQLTLTSIFGNTWKFVGETEGLRGLRGYHAEIISVDDLIELDFMADRKETKLNETARHN